MKAIVEAIQMLSKQDPKLCVAKSEVDTTLGYNPAELLDKYGITKNDLIRLERLGLAVRARYEVRHPKANMWDALDAKIAEHNAKRAEGSPEIPNVPRKCGTHRVRWILFTPENAK